ncbi:hypothetical protein J9332_44165, partial [Aquimarina celericrescens]|nr:hypothetical protein [Aquimarina celericrescens]
GYIKKDYTKKTNTQSEEKIKIVAEKDIETKSDKKSSSETKAKEKKQLDPAELVEQWNQVYPIGTKVISDFYDTELETRTEA